MDLSTLEMTKSFCSKFSKTRRLFNEQEQPRVLDAQRATCTYSCIREKEKQFSLRGWLNYELVGTSTPGKQLLPLRAGFSCNFFTTCFITCFYCLMLVQQALALEHYWSVNTNSQQYLLAASTPFSSNAQVNYVSANQSPHTRTTKTARRPFSMSLQAGAAGRQKSCKKKLTLEQSRGTGISEISYEAVNRKLADALFSSSHLSQIQPHTCRAHHPVKT